MCTYLYTNAGMHCDTCVDAYRRERYEHFCCLLVISSYPTKKVPTIRLTYICMQPRLSAATRRGVSIHIYRRAGRSNCKRCPSWQSCLFARTSKVTPLSSSSCTALGEQTPTCPVSWWGTTGQPLGVYWDSTDSCTPQRLQVTDSATRDCCRSPWNPTDVKKTRCGRPRLRLRV